MKTTSGELRRTIVQEGEEILRQTSNLVPEKMFGSGELKTLIAQMSEALDAEPDGVALAAPQIGVPLRVFIVRVDRTVHTKPTAAHPKKDASKQASAPLVVTPHLEVYINPEIIRRSRKKQVVDEGCLSVRGIYGTTKRHERATIRARREDGSHVERGAGGLLAQIFEHEVDHLNGILFIDHATQLAEIQHSHDTIPD